MTKKDDNLNFEKFFINTKRFVSEQDRNGEKVKVVTIEHLYETSLEDLWDALTNKERLERWFASISGELKIGGHYKVEGNAEGEITECSKPNSFSLTWEFGGQVSWVEIKLTQIKNNTVKLKLNHIAYISPHWEMYGAGAVGVGWELALFGLMYYKENPEKPKINESEFVGSDKGNNFIKKINREWGIASIKAGENAEAVKNAVKRTIAFYTGSKENS